jgi:hypothetical protein
MSELPTYTPLAGYGAPLHTAKAQAAVAAAIREAESKDVRT